MSRTLIKGDQIKLTDFIKSVANANWGSDTLTVSAAAILDKIRSEIAGVSGAMQFRDNWSAAATDAASVTGIKKGYVYVYNGTGTAPTGVTLENGDTLISNTDSADPTDATDWIVVNVNITGAVTLANLVESLNAKVVGAGSVSISAPTTGSNAGKLVITGAFPTINNGPAVSGQYVTGMSINASGVITLTRASLPQATDYRRYKVVGETPDGNINGTNGTFVTLHRPYSSDLVAVYVNGVRQKEGLGNDYSIDIPVSGNNAGYGVIKFVDGAYIPQSGDTLLVDYIAMDVVRAAQ